MATCRRLSSEGWAIVATDLRGESLGSLSDVAGVVLRVAGDVSDSAFVQRVALLAEQKGTLVGWVNSVGALSEAPLHLLDDSAINKQLSINLLTTIFGCREALRSFIRSSTLGSIVNISSIHGVQPFDELPLYAASKGAIEALTRQLCVEYAKMGIRINAVAPGAVNTTMTTGTNPDRMDEILRAAADLSPMNRVSSADEVASVINFLLSDEAAGFNGTVIRMDNGMAATGRNR